MQDIEYIKSMYPMGIRVIQNYVSEACDRLDYKNSPMYDEYPDQTMVNRLCDTICDTVLLSDENGAVSNSGNISKEKMEGENNSKKRLSGEADMELQEIGCGERMIAAHARGLGPGPRPPMPGPVGPGPRPPMPGPVGPGPRPPMPGPIGPGPRTLHNSQKQRYPIWLWDMVKVLLLNEMYERRCSRSD